MNAFHAHRNLLFTLAYDLLGSVADAALLAYAAGNLICALAPNLLVLVLGRIVTGWAGPRSPCSRSSPSPG
ncbi:hypothetical protein [Nonomuraea longicatena]|uniref:MFS transporter n=1 Tax=Nonomuraea longicatena TaxID=83682 RepID=A0ABN1PV05_9ACTN